MWLTVQCLCLTFGNTSKADISHTAFPFLVFMSSSVGNLQEFRRVPLKWKDLFVTYTYWYTVLPCRGGREIHLTYLSISNGKNKESACKAKTQFQSVSGRSPEEWNGNPPQYSCLENPIARGAWQAMVHGVAVGHNCTANTFTFHI